VVLPGDGPDWRHSYHLYVVRLEPAQRERVLAEGLRLGLPLSLHYALACHQHPYVIARCGPLAALPHTERCVAEILTLPLHPYLDEACVDDVVHRLLQLLA
jgi:dTDP-4-amino-4,6-dideoxygalactose transaminase